jgi:hypothetical protein
MRKADPSGERRLRDDNLMVFRELWKRQSCGKVGVATPGRSSRLRRMAAIVNRPYDEKTFERLEMRSSSITRGVMLTNSNMHKPCLTADTFNPIRAPKPELSM